MWYKIYNELPPINTEVLVYSKRSKKWGLDRRVEGFSGNDWSWRDHNKLEITHWLYLPPKP